jgi:hypothetical protein
MSRENPQKPYHAPGKGDGSYLDSRSDEELLRLANDPLCIEREKCGAFLEQRSAKRERYQAAVSEQKSKADAERAARLEAKRRDLSDNPFDARTEISADAKHVASRVVLHLWILFVLLPIALGILYAILK